MCVNEKAENAYRQIQAARQAGVAQACAGNQHAFRRNLVYETVQLRNAVVSVKSALAVFARTDSRPEMGSVRSRER